MKENMQKYSLLFIRLNYVINWKQLYYLRARLYWALRWLFLSLHLDSFHTWNCISQTAWTAVANKADRHDWIFVSWVPAFSPTCKGSQNSFRGILFFPSCKKIFWGTVPCLLAVGASQIHGHNLSAARPREHPISPAMKWNTVLSSVQEQVHCAKCSAGTMQLRPTHFLLNHFLCLYKMLKSNVFSHRNLLQTCCKCKGRGFQMSDKQVCLTVNSTRVSSLYVFF